LFAQPVNLARPAFLRMALDLARFFREGRSLVGRLPAEASIEDLARAGGFGRGFVDWHLLPLGSALWSAPPSAFRRYPARFVMEFLARHDMLEGDLSRRVAWRTIVGGSARYVAAIADRLDGAIRRGERVLAARRGPSGVRVRTARSDELYDQVVFACHGDEALALLENPTPAERAILGAVRYQPNDVVLHTDTRLLPWRQRARAAWNYHVRDDRDLATVTYDLNRLQGFASRTRFLVTLNESEAIDPALVLQRWTWSHPQASAAWARARADFARIQGADRAWFCGAWLGNGFHEDGVRSAEDVARGLAVAVAA
jgi:predicted NAD/FAD-binding protein